ncbi:serine--tRNA ligase [bacterium]|nr:serine--tRNA ligase [bacterium]
MLDIKFIRDNIDRVKKACRDKNEDADINMLIQIDQERRQFIKEVDSLREKNNKIASEIGELVRSGQDISNLKDEAKAISNQIKDKEQELKELQAKLDLLLLKVPNIPDPSVPVGFNEEQNLDISEYGGKPQYDFEVRDHYFLGEVLDILDFKRGAKIAGSFFPMYKGDGAHLKRALINFMFEVHTLEHGYTEVSPPFLANRDSMTGTGQLPKLENDMYYVESDDLFLIPTGEVPVTNIYRDEYIPEAKLPVKFVTYTPCFRREAGAYGKDTKGLIRVHQFDKVELVKFTHPESSYDEHENLLKDAENILQRLGLHYRVRLLCTGDLSFSAAKCYDIEVWAPGTGKYLEVSSCSNFEDFQARRASIKFKSKATGKSEYVHTLNASGVALPRLVIAILETYQTKNGKINVPDCLKKYFNGKEIIG